MDTKGQFTYFLLSVAIGFVGGLLYEIFAFFRFLFGCNRKKARTTGIVLDVLFGISFGIFCIYVCYFLRFPDFRGYMALGWGIGLIIYIKTMRRIVAFFEKVCYNGITKLGKRAKTDKKLLKREDFDI